MAVIRFAKPGKVDLQIDSGANLMQSLLQNGIPVASSCHGEAVCAKCKVQIVAGAEFLSQPSEREAFLKSKNKIPPSWRISCQVLVHGDITVDTGYW